MNLEHEFLSCIVYGEKNIKSSDIRLEMLSEIYAKAYIYCCDFNEKHNRIPGPEIIFNEFAIRLGPPTSDFEYIKDQLKKKYFYGMTKTIFGEIGNLLKTKDLENIEEKFDDYSRRIRSASFKDSGLDDLFSTSKNKSNVDKYNDRKNGIYGIVTPWPTLTEWTWGWQQGDLALFGARSSVGKTWLILHMAHHSWKAKKKIFLITAEMGRIAVLDRFASIHLKINYDHIRKGQLSTASEKLYFDFIMNEKENAGNLFVFSDKFEMDIERLKTAIERERPDCVYIDGVYLLKTNKERDRVKSAAIIANEVKQMAKTYNVPIVCTTQLNKDAINTKISEITIGHFVLSDAWAWNCIGENSIIHCENGLLKVSEMWKGSPSLIKVFDGREYREAVLAKTKEKEVFYVEFEDGRFVECSGDHKVKVFNGIDGFEFIDASKLTKDHLCLLDGIGCKGVDYRIDYEVTKGKHYINDFIVPKYIDEDFSYLIGFITGNGNIQQYENRAIVSIAVCPEDKDVSLKLKKIIKKIDLDFSFRDKSKGDNVTCDTIIVNSKCFVDMLAKLGVTKSLARYKEIPFSIRMSQSKIRRSFIKGLFDSDGSVAKGGSITYSTMSKQLAIQTKMLLETEGIGCVLRKGGMNSPHGLGYKIRLSVQDSRNFRDKIGFSCKRKNKMTQERLRPQAELMIKYNEFLPGTFNFIRITRVIPTGAKEMMYDIVMNGDPHQFVCNGIVVHNCDWGFALGKDTKGTNPVMVVKPLKMREGEMAREMCINWDFFNHDFSEYSETKNQSVYKSPF